MDAAKALIQVHGYDSVDEMAAGDCITVDLDRWVMTFVIEKRGPDRVSVGQYYTHYGDRRSDPEIIFRIEDDQWTPIRYTQHPHIHRYDENGLPDVARFVTQWSRNLTQQGFITAVTRHQTEVTAQ